MNIGPIRTSSPFPSNQADLVSRKQNASQALSQFRSVIANASGNTPQEAEQVAERILQLHQVIQKEQQR